MLFQDKAAGRTKNAPAAAPTITAPTSSQSESSITDGSSRQPSPERRVRSPSREDKRRKLREEQQERQLKTTYSQQSIPLGRSTEEPRSHPRSGNHHLLLLLFHWILPICRVACMTVHLPSPHCPAPSGRPLFLFPGLSILKTFLSMCSSSHCYV